MIKSPLRYPGGKSRAIDLIAKLIPEFDEYREPFLGGGSIFVYLKQLYPNKKFWINDIYSELYKFWEVSQNNINSLVDQINTWKVKYQNGKELYNYLRSNKDKFNDIQIAGAFFVFNRITFSGTTESGGYSNQAFLNRFTESSIQRLKDLSKLLPNTRITNLDYQTAIEETGDNVFIFLDPPYFSATKSALYGKNGNLHKQFVHERFAEVMRNCKHKWLITYDDSQFIRNKFHFANVIPFKLIYGMRNQTIHSNQKGHEIFISNFIGDNIYELATGQERLFAEPTPIYKP